MAKNQLDKRVQAFRKFNRFYTIQVGLLNQGLLKTRFSLTQSRILFELAHKKQMTASDLIRELGVDPGYLSRIIGLFEREGLVKRVRSKSDSRQRPLTLTTKGKKTFSTLNKRSTQEARNLLAKLSNEDQQELIRAMQRIQGLLEPERKETHAFLLRSHRPGDIGWIIHRHGALYAEEYDWDEAFEGLVGEILVSFLRQHDPKRERIWIGEMDGERIGSVMVVNAGNQVAQLRLLLLEPKARGKGLGKRLVNECVQFAREKGYRKIKLWTQSNLVEARQLYIKAGFQLVKEKPHHSFGHDLVSEVWEMPLTGKGLADLRIGS